MFPEEIKIFLFRAFLQTVRKSKRILFFAIKGKEINGEKFINDAISKGATVVICSKKCKIKKKDVLVIKTKKIKVF